MSLILCPKCGGRVSTMAGTCPTCGVAIRRNLTTCPACGAHALTSEGKCPSCGESLPQGGEPLITKPTVKNSTATSQPIQTATASTASRLSRKGARRLILTAILLVAVVGVTYYYYAQWQREREEELFAQVMLTTQPDFCQDFLDRYPHSEHCAEVEAYLQQLLEEAEEWQALLQSPTRKLVHAFMESHPNTVHMRDCKTLSDSLDWADASERKTEKVLNAYLADHPDGAYLEEANHLLEQIKLCRVTPQNVTMIRGVLESFFTRAFVDHKAKDVRECLAADTLRFGDKQQATVKDILASNLAAKEKDVLGKHFMVKGEPSIEKTLDEAENLTYHVRCTVVQTINRSNAKKNISLNHRVRATYTQNFKLMSIVIE